MGTKRQPKARQPPSGKRTPLARTPSGSSQQERPIFCFRYADRNPSHALAFTPTDEHGLPILDFLCEIARLTWAEIEAQRSGTRERHKKHHDQQLDTLDDDDAVAFVRQNKLDEIFGDSIFRFRMTGEQRLWGFRDGHVFHVLFWDPGHQGYVVTKS